MAPPILWPFQSQVIADVNAEIARGNRRVLVVSPTGSGKTVIASAYISDAVASGKRVLFLDHRVELTRQSVAKLFAAGIDAGIIQAGFRPRPEQPVQVASVQTLHARAVRTRSIEAPEADVVMVDEAHHIRARTYQRILELYPNAIIIGLTATPCRGDSKGLGNAFDAIVEAPQVAELTAAGYLVPARIYAPSRPDLEGVRVERGDYVESQLASRMDRPELVGDIVSHWHRLAERRRTVVFATGVAHSAHLRDEFRRSGVLAEHIDGGTPPEEREGILRRFADGQVEVITNCAVLTEGFDCPDAGCLVLARPTRSLGLYRQMAGRVLRIAPGKKDAIIIDHAGAVYEHGFPDDPIKWTLREDGRAANKAHASRGQSAGMPRLTTCPECYAVRFEGKPCTICGWKPRPKAQSFDVAEGDLGELQRDRSIRAGGMDRGDFYAMLLHIARERGYQKGWAAYKYKEKFGSWPQWRFIDPIPPDEAVRAWVRSRQIAYAKAMQKAGAA